VAADEIFVIDTSSIAEIRRRIPKTEIRDVYKALTKLVTDGELVFPDKVYCELERWHDPDPNKPDPPFEWTKANRTRATEQDAPYDALVEALGQASDVCDPTRVTAGGVEDADPYVVAMAMHLETLGYRCTVLTEDRKDGPLKISLATACGVLRLPTVPILTFLERRKIWKRP
jgi:hypothetical protein